MTKGVPNFTAIPVQRFQRYNNLYTCTAAYVLEHPYRLSDIGQLHVDIKRDRQS